LLSIILKKWQAWAHEKQYEDKNSEWLEKFFERKLTEKVFRSLKKYTFVIGKRFIRRREMEKIQNEVQQ